MDVFNPLGPISIAAVAIQQILEVFSPVVERYVSEARKKAVLGVIGFSIGLILALVFKLRLIEYSGYGAYGLGAGTIDVIVTALVLSMGTEGTNSVLKFLKYLKEDKKLSAANSLQSLSARSEAPQRSASITPAALQTLAKLRAAAGRSDGSAPISVRAAGINSTSAPAKALANIENK